MKLIVRIIAFLITAFLCWIFLPHEDLWDLLFFLWWLILGTGCLSGLALVIMGEDD